MKKLIRAIRAITMCRQSSPRARPTAVQDLHSRGIDVSPDKFEGCHAQFILLVPEHIQAPNDLQRDSIPTDTFQREADMTTSAQDFVSATVRRWWLALLVIVTVLATDAFVTLNQQPSYLARATLIISPSRDVERSSLVYSVDSLGRGRIVGTYAEVLNSEVLQRQTLAQLGYPQELLNREIFMRGASVADAAIVQVTAESPNPTTSADIANSIGDLAIARMSEVYPPYSLTFLTRATPPTRTYRPDYIRNFAAGALVGVTLAIVVAYLYDLLYARARRRSARASHEQEAANSVAPEQLGSRSAHAPSA
jgi:capsular polysaccharide biosynthesis protein